MGRSEAFACAMWLAISCSIVSAQDSSARIRAAQDFNTRAQQRTGLLVPMYLYPENIHTNRLWNDLIALKRKYETVPFWVIVNPASGPGTQVDANYTKAIDRLVGSGCVVIGYVSTQYKKRAVAEIQADLEKWKKFYPRVHGIFFDEMENKDTAESVDHQIELTKRSNALGYWPTVANPGTATPERFFAKNAADVFVVREANAWPDEKTLHGDYFGGYSDYPPFTRAILLHSQASLDKAKLAMARKYVRWIYLTEDLYRENDPKADNPWNSLSKHLDELCAELAK